MKIFFTIAISVVGFTHLFAQVGISTTSITPDASSILELRSTTKGFLPPRMTTTERNAITPVAGLVIYNITTGFLEVYSGSSWQANLTSLPATVVYNNQANSYTAGSKQTFQANTTTAGFKFGGVTANPSTLASGDMWYRSDENKVRYYDGTTIRALVGEALTQTITNKDLTSNTNTFPTFNQNTTGSSASFTGSLAGDVTGTQGATIVGKINGVSLAGLTTGILKNTTTTGVPSIAVAGTDYSIPAGIETFSGAKTFNSTKLILAGSTSGTTTLNANAVAGAGTVTLPLGGTLATTSNDLSAFAATTSAQLAGVLSDETGTGSSVFSTSPTLVSPILGVANATSLGITGTGGNGFIGLTTQSTNPAAPIAGTVLFSNANSKLSWRGSANTFVKTFDGAAVTADRIYSLPDAPGTIPVSASGNIALSTAGNISFAGTLPIANGGTNSTATPTNGGITYGDGTAYQFSVAGTSGQVLTSNGAAAPTWKNSRTIVELASDVVSNTTANTIADVTGLSFAVINGINYRFKATIYYTSAATATGSRWSINGPANTLLAYTSTYPLTATTQTLNANLVGYDLPAASNATSATTTGNIAIIEGMIRPSASGTVILRFASETTSAITAKAGSTLEWW